MSHFRYAFVMWYTCVTCDVVASRDNICPNRLKFPLYFSRKYVCCQVEIRLTLKIEQEVSRFCLKSLATLRVRSDMETLMKGSIVIACMAFFLGLEQIDASSSKIELHEKLGDLWENRKDKSMNFYDFMAKEVLPRQHTLFQGVDTRLPDYLVTAKPGGANFPCQLFHNHSNPTSVHRLKPSDIDYVASLGDSITAAFGAKSRSLLEIFVEFRGVSWSIGGDDSLKHVVTLPNIIKEYYSDVRGFSVKTTPPKIRIPWRSHLNFAVSGDLLHRYEIENFFSNVQSFHSSNL